MKIAVYDTYVRRADGRRMHFDILVHDNEQARAKVLDHGRLYLSAKGMADAPLTAKECSFCHTEFASPEVERELAAEGFAIIELQNCD